MEGKINMGSQQQYGNKTSSTNQSSTKGSSAQRSSLNQSKGNQQINPPQNTQIVKGKPSYDAEGLVNSLSSILTNYETYTAAMFECFRKANIEEESFQRLRNFVVQDMLNYQAVVVPMVKTLLASIRELCDFEKEICQTKEQQFENNSDFLSLAKDVMNAFQYIDEIHTLIMDKAYIRSLMAQETVANLEIQINTLTNEINASEQNIIQQTKMGKGSIKPKQGQQFDNARQQYDVVQQQSTIQMKKENKDNTIYAINIIQQALLPSIKMYLESFESLSKFFKVIQKDAEFIANKQNNQQYQLLKANELFNFLYPLSAKISQATLKISGGYATAHSSFGAMEMLQDEQNDSQMWKDVLEKQKAKFLKDIFEKETQYYQTLNMKNINMPQVSYKNSEDEDMDPEY